MRLERGTGTHKNKDFPNLLLKSDPRRGGTREGTLFSISCLTMCVSGGDLRKKNMCFCNLRVVCGTGVRDWS